MKKDIFSGFLICCVILSFLTGCKKNDFDKPETNTNITLAEKPSPTECTAETAEVKKHKIMYRFITMQ